jgi:hypothetical protein
MNSRQCALDPRNRYLFRKKSSEGAHPPAVDSVLSIRLLGDADYPICGIRVHNGLVRPRLEAIKSYLWLPTSVLVQSRPKS